MMRFINLCLVVFITGLLGCSDNVVGLEGAQETAGVSTLEGQGVWSAGKHLAPGTVSTLWSLPMGDSPEGMALDKSGNIYVSVRRTVGADRISQIVRITPGGEITLFASLPTANAGATGALGLVVTPKGTIYVAHNTDDPTTHGVWWISPDGEAMGHIAGSEQLVFPNALTFDARGTLYVTDSFGGAVWRYGKDGSFTPWLQHPLLEAVPVPGSPIPIPGANGIAFFPPNKLYVANTSQFSLVRIFIAPDGSASDVEVIAQGLALLSIDGIAVDVHENVYGVLAASNAEETGTPINPVPPLMKIDPASGVVTSVVAPADFDAFDAPTSLAFGTGSRDRKSVFIVNSALFGPISNGPGPGMVEVAIGIPGAPGK